MSDLSEQQERFYVYAVLVAGRIKYIGKGTGRRFRAHLGQACQNPRLKEAIQKARITGASIKVRTLRSGLTEHAALKLERALIEKHKHRLLNIANGNRSKAETILAAVYHEWRCLLTESEIRAQGAWQGLNVDRRLEINRMLRGRLAELAIWARDSIGSEKQSKNHV